MINGPPTTEDDPDGLMSVKYMETLFAAWKVGCWFWQDDDQPPMYRDLRTQKAAPIAEGGRDIIEQAKEEAFFAWGL